MSDYDQFQVHSAYELLAVQPTATRSEILAAYKKIITAVHPDRTNSMTNTLAQLVNEAKRVLIEEREEYDRWRQSGHRTTARDAQQEDATTSTPSETVDPWDVPPPPGSAYGSPPPPSGGASPPHPSTLRTPPPRPQPTPGFSDPTALRTIRIGGLAARALDGGFAWYVRGILSAFFIAPIAVIYTAVAWFQLTRLVRFNGNGAARFKRVVVVVLGSLALLVTLSYPTSLLSPR